MISGFFGNKLFLTRLFGVVVLVIAWREVAWSDEVLRIRRIIVAGWHCIAWRT